MIDNPPEHSAMRTKLTDLAVLFLQLGTTAFGGPAAHIAMMQNEVVRRRAWMTEQEFLDLISACNLIPGPNSTEMAIHIGHRRAGWPGLLVAGICFILPSTAIVLAIAWAYVQYSQLPAVSHLMNGIKPIIIAIILQAFFSLSKTALRDSFLKALCLLVFAVCFFYDNQLVLLLAGGTLSLFWSAKRERPIGKTTHVSIVLVLLMALSITSAITATGPAHLETVDTTFSLQSLFLYFLKLGSVLYGSGYVLLAFLRSDLIEHRHWLSSAQLLDATAVGQVTPGPVFTTATFIGYLLGGSSGALLATLGIFLPAFFFVAITAPFIGRLRKSKIASATIDGINASSLALMAFVTFELGRDSLTQPLFAGECAVAALLLWKYNINPTWLILAGAMIGLCYYH